MFSYFFSIRDYTIIAGIIAFFGAVIGGVITWLGVKLTIDISNRVKELDTIPTKIENINKFYNELTGLCDEVFGNDTPRAFFSANNILKYIEEREMVTKSLLISEKVHTEFQNLVRYAQHTMYNNLRAEDSFEVYSNFIDEIKLKVDNLKKTLAFEQIKYTNYYFNSKNKLNFFV